MRFQRVQTQKSKAACSRFAHDESVPTLEQWRSDRCERSVSPKTELLAAAATQQHQLLLKRRQINPERCLTASSVR
eukprot:6738-Heterococcus_DN1.PRE.3